MAAKRDERSRALAQKEGFGFRFYED